MPKSFLSSPGLSARPRPQQQRQLLLTLIITLLAIQGTKCCTNVLVTPSASVDGSAMISYDADSADLMGTLYHYPATKSSDDDSSFENDGGGLASPKMRQIYDWDSGRHLGAIPEAPQTYNVVGNTNEEGLVIAETTFGGIELAQPHGVIDYGSLIYITLQRASTARGAIRTMTTLLDKYGYASDGESFSIADRSGEVWIMEVIGRGKNPDKVGAVWVARRIPDGYVSSHANQARITTFPRNDPENCMYAHDVVDLAVELGLYDRIDGDDDDEKFSFSDVYDPLTFTGARFCEARVWSVFGAIDATITDKYRDYASGVNLTNRMPLWIKPEHKLSLGNITAFMANHYDNTPLETFSDIGAGLYSTPYRPHPLKWSYNGREFFNERTIGTQQTGWNFIAQIRLNLPAPLSSVLWFGVDDSATSPRFPVYGSSTRVSAAYGGLGSQDGVKEPLLSFDLTKAFWVQNMVSNFAYSRWSNISPILKDKLDSVRMRFEKELKNMDEEALSLHRELGVEDMVEYVTDYSVKAGDSLHAEWMGFYGELFVRFRDGYDIVKDDTQESCGCKTNQDGFTDEWKERIVDDTNERYMIPDGASGGGDHSDSSNGDDDDDGSAGRVSIRGSVATATLRIEKDNYVYKPIDKLKLKALQ